MPLELLQILWYLVVGSAGVFYVILDGFDLGVGSLQIFGGTDRNRRIFLNSIGPFWDGNEVWLIIIVGALFVGFPDVYAVVLSGFYLLFMCLLSGVIFRAVAIEFRSKHPSKVWRAAWDGIFWLSSLVITFAIGLILGNLIKGVPVDNARELYYSFEAVLNPYSICIGLLSIFLFAMHGNFFLLMKTEDEVYARLRKFIPLTTTAFFLSLIIMTIWTWLEFPYMGKRFIEYPISWLLPILVLGAIIAMLTFSKKRSDGLAFAFSMVTITLLFALFAVGTFPNLVISSIGPEFNLTLYNSSAEYMTLTIALIIAGIGVPLVLAYGWLLYYIFKGKTRLHKHSY
jgi:cytochrome d ubiquinol oxidase subunit II